MQKPFRWTVAKREQLGTLRSAAHLPPDRAFVADVRNTAARILAFAGNADLAFIGRSPENFYDYLSGAFAGLDDAPKLHLIQFSLRWIAKGENPHAPEKLAAMAAYLREEGVDPKAIAAGDRPLALVDTISDGGTMENLVRILHLLAKRSRVDWNAVQRRLRIIGLIDRGKNSPNAWRWQQHQDWLHLIPDAEIMNVSARQDFIYYITGYQAKVTTSFTSSRWTEPVKGAPKPTDEQREAIAFAADLYDLGRTREERKALAARIAKTQQMRNPVTRALVLSLRGGRSRKP